MLPTSTLLTSFDLKPAEKVSPIAKMTPAFFSKELFLQLGHTATPCLARFGLSLPYGRDSISSTEAYNLDVSVDNADVINYIANLDGKIESAVNADPVKYFHHITPSSYVPMLRERDGQRYVRVKVPASGEGVTATRMLQDGTLAPANVKDILPNTPITPIVRFNGIYFTDKSYACSLKLVRVIIHTKHVTAAPDFI